MNDCERSDLLRQSGVCAMKEYSCVECGKPISGGMSHLYEAGFWDSDDNPFKTCLRCYRVRERLGEILGRRITYGNLIPELKEHGRMKKARNGKEEGGGCEEESYKGPHQSLHLVSHVQ